VKHSLKRYHCSLIVVAFLVAASPPACAGWTETLQYHGFLSQGFVLTSDNRFYGTSEKGSFDLTEIGLNASVRPLSRLGISAQVLYRRAGEMDDTEVRLDYGLLDYTVLSLEDFRLGVLLGRYKNPLGLYNETRDVAFTRPSIFLPQSIYFDRTRNLALAFDGGLLYAEYNGSFGDVSLRLGAGRPTVNSTELERLIISENGPGELEDQTSYIGQLLYELGGGRLRLAASGAALNVRYRPGPNDRFGNGQLRFQPVIFSAQYNGENFSLTSEYAIRPSNLKNFGAFPTTQFTGESYYFQGTYRLADDWEVIARYDVFYGNREDRYGGDYEATTRRPGFNRYAKDWTVGLRWDVTPSLMLRAEYHRVHGTGWLAVSENPDLRRLDPDWDLFAVLLSFRF
jgi:hypothetical protein